MKAKRLACGLIPVSLDPEPLFLILRVYNYWDFPKGEIEEGETPLTCARRELREETGLRTAGLDWGREFVETAPYSGGKVARYYLGRVDTQEVKLSREHHGYRWASYEDVRGLLVPRLQLVLDWAKARLEMKR